jgi:hypothetical protein
LWDQAHATVGCRAIDTTSNITCAVVPSSCVVVGIHVFTHGFLVVVCIHVGIILALAISGCRWTRMCHSGVLRMQFIEQVLTTPYESMHVPACLCKSIRIRTRRCKFTQVPTSRYKSVQAHAQTYKAIEIKVLSSLTDCARCPSSLTACGRCPTNVFEPDRLRSALQASCIRFTILC